MSASIQSHPPASRAVNRVLERHYEPNRRLAAAHGLTGYNCGYAETRGQTSFAEHQRALVFRLLGDAPIGPESVVVDIGSGIGGPARWIAEAFRPARVIGLEYCWASVRAAQSGGGDDFQDGEGGNGRAVGAGGIARAPRFLRGDAQCIPLGDASVDVIFNLESALHYPDKRSFLAECARVLRPGGRLCVGDITLGVRALAAPMRLSNWLPSQDNSYSHLWTRGQYMEAIRGCGLELLRHENVSRGVAASLRDGMDEVRRRGFRASRGYRRRVLYLAVLRGLLRMGCLRYELFALRIPGPTTSGTASPARQSMPTRR